ncbi:DnaD domain protein [Paenibacillus sp. GYB004]|uniref:DnaD domain protein n=1 Tax=Paenibacillus sp. GYB004 TaxID=2994393 RepID=UPI002F960D86
MDYNSEINAFIDWLETNPLDATTQALWFHLMAIANKSGSPEWFAVTNLTLMAKTGISEKSLIKHRLLLVQKGRLQYKNQGKKQAGKYQMVSFTGNNTVIEGVKGEVNRGVTKGVEGSALLKDLKDLNHSTTSTTAACGNEYESFYAAHIRVYGFECNQFQANKLAVYIDQDGMDESVVVRSIERAALANKGSAYRFNLITKILNDYFRAGAKTLEAAKEVDARFDSGITDTVSHSGSRQASQKTFDLLDQIVEEEERG